MRPWKPELDNSMTSSGLPLPPPLKVREALEAIGWRRGLCSWVLLFVTGFASLSCWKATALISLCGVFLARCWGHCIDIWSLSSARSLGVCSWGDPDRGEGPKGMWRGKPHFACGGGRGSLLSAALGKDLKRRRQR